MSKHNGGLGFRNLYGFNIALIGKLCWNFLKHPQSLVARVFKARYYPHTDFLQARMQQGASYIWSGIMTAKESLHKGYRWVLGNGLSINVVKDSWLKEKDGFCASQNEEYGVGHISVAEFITQSKNSWDENNVCNFFSEADASLILATHIPNRNHSDRITWIRTTNGQYSVKTGYHLWCDQHLRNDSITQSSGWSKLWRLDIPHKLKVFLWRFCRNNIHVRWRLRSKGVSLPTSCPMCLTDVEHKLHVFFDCPFAASCLHYVGANYDISMVEFDPDCLLQKISSATHGEIITIVRVLWGI